MSDQIIDNLKKYGSEFQAKCIAGLLSDSTFMERLSDIVDPTSFESDAHQWIVKEIISYFVEFKSLPTMIVFKVKVENIQNDLLKKSVINHLDSAFKSISAVDLAYVKEQFLEFCKNQKIKAALIEGVDLMKAGNYEKIRTSFDAALKAGMERNVGHDYLNEIEKRMSVMCRESIKTNWGEIDLLMDGGLAKGELGIIVAPAGIGKCIGGNTEIEIQYNETGIPIKGNSGKEYILWMKPFEKYDLGQGFGNLFGWQINNILFEIEKLKATALNELPPQESGNT